MSDKTKKPKQVKCGHPNCFNPDACKYPKCNKQDDKKKK
jgi:hypothetical protein